MENNNWEKISGSLQNAGKSLDSKTRNALKWVFRIAAALVLGAFTAILFFQSVTLQENSMEPTMSVGERYFINRAVYRFSSPQRGDIIVFRTSSSKDAALHIRRVIGLPGETIQIKDGKIYIDGEVYNEGNRFAEISSAGLASDGLKLESNEYFVLGDNRNNSEDSRYADIGMVNKRYIVGKIWFIISPTSKIGFMEG